MFSGSDWMSDWNKAETFSLRIGEICSAIPVRGSWEPNDRIALAMGTFVLAREHHSSIHLLFGHNKRVSANALMRPLLEAALRTVWLAEKATEEEINAFLKRERKLPTLGELKRGLKLTGDYQGLLNSFTHGGISALAVHYFEGEQRELTNAVMIAQAGMCLGFSGYVIAHHLGLQDFVTQLTDATPIID
jgi:hypothetical protein